MAQKTAGKKTWLGTRRRMFVDQTIAQADTKGAVLAELRKRYDRVKLTSNARDWWGRPLYEYTARDKATGETEFLTVRPVQK